MAASEPIREDVWGLGKESVDGSVRALHHPDNVSRSVFITGCSSGIGRATALHLASRGWKVYATARRMESIEDLAGQGCQLLRVDVCDERSMEEAVRAVEAKEGRVGVLVNNAGYGLMGAVEELRLEQVRSEFETNLFGSLRLIQLVLPGMREQGWGKIVNVSSVGGKITTPGNGSYHASKHALEALSDVLRFEVRAFGVHVIVIEPGAIRTRWVETAVQDMENRPEKQGPYSRFHAAVADQLRGAHRGVLAMTAAGPEAVARVIERAITTSRPRTRYTVPKAARLFSASSRVMPDPVWDAFMRLIYPSPGDSKKSRERVQYRCVV